MLNPYLLLGTIVKPQGIRGEVKLRHETDDPERFNDLTTVFLKNGDAYVPVQVLAARVNGDDAFLTLEGICDRDAAETLRNQNVYIDRAHARKLGEGEAFIADMLGLTAVDGEGRAVGTLSNVLQNGGTDILVFDTPRGVMMAPFLKRLVRELDVAAGRMVLDAQALAEVALYENSDPDHLS
ncbi:MAG TPA: ribosome maturation factor RimM [Candidatus Limiplasma sp.]|nr:ribosome maturation factor RimM [Candidatus Limiplasma sp.]